MKKIFLGIYYVAYLMCKYLPRSSAKLSGGVLRSFFAKKIIESAGKNINIEKGATFSRRLSIGHDGSGCFDLHNQS